MNRHHRTTLPLPTHLLLAALVALVAPVARAQHTPAFVSIDAEWEKGDKRHYEMTRTREDHRKGEKTKISSAVIPLTIEVVSTSDEGSKIAWTTGVYRMASGEKIDREQLPESVQRMLEELRIVITLDRFLSVTGVANLTVVRQKVLAAFDAMAKQLGAGRDPSSGEVFERVRAMIGQDEILSAMLLKEAQAYFTPHGSVFREGEPQVTRHQIPNPLGSEPFPVITTMSLRALDTTTQIATIHVTTVFEPKESARILRKSLEKIAGSGVAKLDEKNLFKQFNIEDELIARVDLRTGWVVDLEASRTVTMQGGRRIDRLEIRERR